MNTAPFRQLATIVTGASSGIGREIALQLAAQGARLALAARDRNALESVARTCRDAGGDARVVPTDVGDPQACKALVDATIDAFGRLDMLVVNAGISQAARLDELETPEPIDRILRVNFLGAAHCTFHALPHLKATGGRVVAMSSLTGKYGVPTRTAYSASKHAMAGFFDSLRIEIADDGVSVTVVYPGFVISAIRARALGADGESVGVSDIDAAHAMSASECARLTLRAAAARRRELVMTTRGRLGLWLRLLSPRLVDRMVRRAAETGR